MSGVVVEGTGPRLVPPPEALAAIVAALEVVAARTAASAPARPSNAWRFSGRTWSAPRALVRDRPLLRHSQ